MRRACRHDSVWRRVLWAEYEMDESNKENPPGYMTCAAAHCRAGAEAEAKSLTWFELYKRWRAHFSVCVYEECVQRSNRCILPRSSPAQSPRLIHFYTTH